MTDKAMSPLRRRMIDDMTMRNLSPSTQETYIRAVAAHACRRDLAVALLLYLEAWKDLRSSDFEKLIRPTGCWSDGE